MESKNRLKRRRINEVNSNTHTTTLPTGETNTYFCQRILFFLCYILGVILLCYLGITYLLRTDYTDSPGQDITYNITCQPSEHDKVYPNCSPNNCARILVNEFLTPHRVSQLVRLVKKALEHGRSDGGASIFDFNSGAISKGDKFINVYSIHTATGEDPVFNDGEFNILYEIIDRVHMRIAGYFGLNKENLYLTNPTFFSEMTARPARTIHDEYWHTHIDKQTYESFEYTSLLYLSEYDRDFKGGSFTYVDNGKESGMTIQPRPGLLSIFTSGNENPHKVEKIRDGVRYALTIGFTCDPNKRINLSNN
ncbi:2-oxoglutarate and iron-dependent oxygenase domain-containing protein 3-like [Oopsacas minuta]|uniref:2-oxoglutarate and iron-dependent oxygenase domain-containing protein 3-like n=1 Tax=Oopsacas minuta TaxID=111878 RepID=A0AAV7K2L4_9METZ|nr:2-oxoglutarate and iron-dependent oxygenase domain-containing protein 3-like [Oopsacas minuta]